MLLRGLVKTEFWEAVKSEDLSKVEEFVRKDRDVVNAKDKIRNTPLYYALLNENKEMAELLLENGADVNIKNVYGKTAFHVAVETENMDLISLCLEYGADVNLENMTGGNSLDIATERENIELVEFLLSKGARPNSSKKDSALHRAVFKGSYDIVKLLLNNGANPTLLNKSEVTPLGVAKKINKTSKDKIIALLNKYVTPRHAVEKRDQATLRESLEQYTINVETEIFKRTEEFFNIENYMNLLKTSAEVRTLVDENKAARKRIKEIQNIFKKNNSTREQIQALRDEEKIEKTKLKNNREIIKTINNVQNNVDDLARLNIVHLMCCLYKNNEGAELTR